MADLIFASFAYLLTPQALMWCFLGTLLGVIFGAIPGLGGGMLMALLLPFTFGMDNVDAQILLIAIYVGGVSGSLISAVLIGVPGSPAAVMTTLDGHAMTKKGQAAKALSLGIVASFLGGLFSWFVLLLLAIPLASIATQFRNFDYFAFVMLGLILVGFTGGDNPIRGVLSGFLGIFFAMVGFDQVSATNRFTFESHTLANGFHILPVLIGVFAVRQMLGDVASNRTAPSQTQMAIRDLVSYFGSALKYPVALIRSSAIGSVIGILPGIGANIGAIISYTVSRALSRDPDRYGKGSEEAIISAESGNNATVGGALVPMIAIGIPGSGQDVILMAALILHHVEPGPLLVVEHPDIFYGIIVSFLFSNIAMLVVMVLAIRYLAKVISTPLYLLVPIVLTFCVVGVVSVNNRTDDAWVMLAFGFLGLAMSYGRFPLAPFVIGFVLGPLAEMRLRSALMSSDGEIMPLFESPFSVVAIICMVVVVASPLLRRLWGATRTSTD